MKASHLGCGGRWSLPGEWHRHRCLHLPLWNYTYQPPESARTQNHCSVVIIYSTQTHTHTHTHTMLQLVFPWVSTHAFTSKLIICHYIYQNGEGLNSTLVLWIILWHMVQKKTYMQLCNDHLNQDVLRENCTKRKLMIKQWAKAWWAGLKGEDVCHQLEVTLADKVTSWFVSKKPVPTSLCCNIHSVIFTC